MKYTVHQPLYLTQLSLSLRAVNKVCIQLSVKDSVVSNRMGGELYISLYLEQNSPLLDNINNEFLNRYLFFSSITVMQNILHNLVMNWKNKKEH